MPPKVPARRHRRFKSFLENKIRHVRVNSKLAFYEKFQAQASKDGKGVISSLPKRNFVITSRKKKTKSQLRDPIRARCPFYARALFDFPTKHEEEMSLMKDALLCVRIVSPSKWCLAQDEEGNEGWVPINYIERVHPKLDANLAFKCAEAEVLGIEKQIDRVNQDLKIAKKSGDGAALQKLEAQLKDLLANKALASSRVMALGSMTTAISSQERARLEVEKAKKDAKNEELVAKAEAWLNDADESVKEALEIVASGKGVAQAASAVSRAEKAALEAVNAAKEAVRESKATTGKDKQLLVKKAEKRLERARGILLTLKRYEEALVERQEATQLILKHHEKNNSGQIDIKMAVARKKDANERASILKIAAARALEEMSASEEIFKISKTITALENKLAKAANKEEKSEIETEIISQKKQLASAQQRADAAERLRDALEKQAKAVASVKEISIAAEGKTPKGETSTQELIQRRRQLEECVGATKKAAYEYEKVFGFDPLKEKEAGKEGGGTSAFEGGEALAKLEAMIDSRSAPSRNGEFSFAEHHQLILDAIQSCSLFNQARLEGPVEVYVGDLDTLYQCTGGDEHTAASILGYLDSHHMQFKKFASLCKKVKEVHDEWEQEKKAVAEVFISEKEWKINSQDMNKIFNRSLSGKLTSTYLKHSPGSWTNDVESTIAYLSGCVQADSEKEYNAKDQCMNLVTQLLAGGAFTVHMRDFRELFQHGLSAQQVLEKMQELVKRGARFQGFSALSDAILGKQSAKSSRGSRQGGGQSPNNVKNRVLKFITSPDCLVFNATSLRVQASVMKSLTDFYSIPQDSSTDLALIQAAHMAFPSFLALATGMKEQAAKPIRERFKKQLKDIFGEESEEQCQTCLNKLAELAPHRLDNMMNLLPVVVGEEKDFNRVISSLQATKRTLMARESDEVQEVVKFLSVELIFTSATTVRKPQILRLVRASLFSKHGLNGGSIKDVLRAVNDKDQCFESYERLLEAVKEKAASM